MTNWNKTSVLLILATVMVMVAACGGSVPNKTSAPSPEKNNSEAVSDKPIELSLWINWKKGSAYTGAYYDRVQKFKEANPNVKLTIEEIPYVDYNVRLQTAAAGKQLPDMMQFISGGPLLQTIARSGALQPLDSVVVNEWKDKMIPSTMLKQFEVDGKQYGIPAEANYGSMIFYNKKILADVGYSKFPTTFDELLALINALNAKKITPISIGNIKGEILTNSYFSIISDRIAGPNSLQKLVDKKSKLTDPEFVAALTKIKQLADAKAFNTDANTIESIEATDRFLKGRAAILIDGSWAISQIIKNKTDDLNVGVAVFPLIEGGKGKLNDLSSVTNQAVVLNAKLDGQKKKAAESFIRFVFNEELFNTLTASAFPVTASNIKIPGSANPVFQDMMMQTKNVENISPTFENIMPTTATTAMFSALQGLIINGGDPNKVAETIQKLLN